jgi:hypothetical protein
MDKTMLENHLAQAERHVALGHEHVQNQRVLIVKLARDGHDTTMARKLLSQFEEIQRSHIADRDRLKDELAACGAARSAQAD